MHQALTLGGFRRAPSPGKFEAPHHLSISQQNTLAQLATLWFICQVFSFGKWHVLKPTLLNGLRSALQSARALVHVWRAPWNAPRRRRRPSARGPSARSSAHRNDRPRVHRGPGGKLRNKMQFLNFLNGKVPLTSLNNSHDSSLSLKRLLPSFGKSDGKRHKTHIYKRTQQVQQR